VRKKPIKPQKSHKIICEKRW